MRRTSHRGVLLAAALALPAACVGSSSANPARDLPAPAQDLVYKDAAPRTAVLAEGCFWCSEGLFERVEGVLDVKSGYAGGTKETADYETVSSGRTGHAESIRVTYDPKKITYGQLLQIFFTTHDPTTKDRSGPDAGHQYRSAIFYGDEAERGVAAAYIKQLDAAHVYDAPIVTSLEPLSAFYPAEAYHQDFVKNNKTCPYVRYWFPGKLDKLRQHVPQLIKKDAATTL